MPQVQGSNNCSKPRPIEGPIKVKIGVVVALVALAVIMTFSAIAADPIKGANITPKLISIIDGACLAVLITGVVLITIGAGKKRESKAPSEKPKGEAPRAE
jgi:uncharacterized membrane protein YozB (DUF420 family)